MANTLTNLTPDLYAALDRVSRELVGLVPAVSRDSGVERAAKDQTVRSFVAPASTASDIAPGQLPADNGDQTIGNKTITISKSRYVPVRWNGEEQRGMNTGPGYNMILQNQFAQAIRTLANEVEADLAGLHAKAARAVDPAGTTLFDAANYKDVANVVKELNINGAPIEDRQLVLGNAAAAAFKGNATYTAANTAGTDDILRQGVLLDHFGMAIRESNQIVDFTKGTGASYLLNDASSAIGDTVIAVDTGSGTILAGDIISFAGDTNKYVVEVALSAGNLTIAAPGLKVALADNAAVTVEDEGQRNMAFSRDAIHLVTRVPARPMEGDSAEDVMIIQDPRSGLAFEVAMYKEYRQVKFEIALAWGYEMIKPEHCMLLVD
jgi:hypothetical protein